MYKIRILRQKFNMRQTDLAKLLKVTQATIAGWESGRRTPDYNILKQIAKIFNVSIDFLLDNEHPKQKGVKIPVLGRVPAGIPVDAVEDIIDWEEIPADWIKNGEEFFALQVKGDSMSPKYIENDVLIIRKQPNCNSGQDAVILINNADATLKKLIKNKDGIVLQPINPAYEPLFYSKKDIENLPVIILGIVVELRRKII